MHKQPSGARDVEVFGDSKLVVQQVTGECQCLDGVLNEYWERCLEIVKGLDSFRISYVPRKKNGEANMLVQQVLGYEVTKGWFSIKRRPTLQETWVSESARQSSVVYPVSIQERLALPRAMVGESVMGKEGIQACRDVNQGERDVSGSGIQGDNADSRARGEQSVASDRDEVVRDMSDDND
jgi:hypothetical protein